MIIIDEKVFGFALSGCVATVRQVAGGMLTAKDIGHLITGKDINGNPLSDEDKHAITSSVILDATMVGVSSLSKLKWKYANKANKMNVTEEVDRADRIMEGLSRKVCKSF